MRWELAACIGHETVFVGHAPMTASGLIISRVIPGITAMLVVLPAWLAAAKVNSPSQSAVDLAIKAPLISYSRSFSGGAYTNGAWFGGASIVLAAASHAGNVSADPRLLQQIRHSIVGGNAICANGGYPAQHELHATGMFAIARHTPRIWNQLSATEKSKIGLLMKAALVASAFTTSDHNPYVLAGTAQRTLDDDYNIHRDWNPNYREGMLGGVLVGMVYFGGPAAAGAILSQYEHASFVSELAAAGLGNPHQVFNWKAANPASTAPSGTQIEDAVRAFKYKGLGLGSYFAIYSALVNDTYGKRVNSGLNGGAGLNGGGMIASGAETLPSSGTLGMLKEFDTVDGNGPRSSIIYCYDGYRPHQTNQLVLIIGGYWPKQSPAASDAAGRLRVGNADLWYKMEKGYFDYHKGMARGLYDLKHFNEIKGFGYVRSLWEDVLLPYHDSAVEIDSDVDGDGTGDSVEIRLGLDPFSGTSRFELRLVASRLEWQGKAGVAFQVQRSTGDPPFSWQSLATLAGVDGINRFSDPAPLPGRAFYRVALLP
jgi:hypothetical protein